LSLPSLFYLFLKKKNSNSKCADLLYNRGLFRRNTAFFAGSFPALYRLSEDIRMQLPNCPKCNSEYVYEDNGMFICPECAHEWNDNEASQDSDALIVKDANGNLLVDGDSVTVIKDLKVKGSSSMLKIGTKVKNIRLVEGDHNIDCKIDGFGPMKLKSEFVKKN
jgi:protein PhnA